MKLRLKRTPRGAETAASQMTLMDHLRELRNRLLKVVACIIVLSVAAYFLYDPIFRFFTDPYCRSLPGTEDDCRFYLTDIVAGFTLRMKVAGYVGTVASIPVILWHLWQFIMPGLYKNERRYAVSFVASSLCLFALGAGLAYLTLPTAISWLTDAAGPSSQITEIPSPDRYFWFSALMMVGFGIGFEFPLLLIALQMVGVLSNATLRKGRRHAAVIITIIVAVLTPGGDPISLVVLSVPMYLFYEGAILVGRLSERRAEKSADRPTAPAS